MGSRQPLTERLTFVRRLGFFFLLGVFFILAHPSANAASPSPQPTATASELVRPQSGNDTFKLASLGVVFLIIGAAVVYAPQIVSSISGLPRRMTGSRPKAKRTEKAKPMPKPQPEPVIETPTQVIEMAPTPPVVRLPERRPIDIPEAHDVVTRLQNEVRSAWSKTR